MYDTRGELNNKVQEKYGFQCECDACQAQSVFGAGRDARHLQIGQLKKDIDTFERLYDIDKFDRLLRKEGLTYPIIAAMCHLVAEGHQGMLLGNPSRPASYEDGNRRAALELPRKEGTRS